MSTKMVRVASSHGDDAREFPPTREGLVQAFEYASEDIGRNVTWGRRTFLQGYHPGWQPEKWAAHWYKIGSKS